MVEARIGLELCTTYSNFRVLADIADLAFEVEDGLLSSIDFALQYDQLPAQLLLLCPRFLLLVCKCILEFGDTATGVPQLPCGGFTLKFTRLALLPLEICSKLVVCAGQPRHFRTQLVVLLQGLVPLILQPRLTCAQVVQDAVIAARAWCSNVAGLKVLNFFAQPADSRIQRLRGWLVHMCKRERIVYSIEFDSISQNQVALVVGPSRRVQRFARLAASEHFKIRVGQQIGKHCFGLLVSLECRGQHFYKDAEFLEIASLLRHLFDVRCAELAVPTLAILLLHVIDRAGSSRQESSRSAGRRVWHASALRACSLLGVDQSGPCRLLEDLRTGFAQTCC